MNVLLLFVERGIADIGRSLIVNQYIKMGSTWARKENIAVNTKKQKTFCKVIIWKTHFPLFVQMTKLQTLWSKGFIIESRTFPQPWHIQEYPFNPWN